MSITPRVIHFGKWVEGITYDGQWLWAAESGQRTIGRGDLHTGVVSKHIKVGRLPVDVLTDPQGGVSTLLGTDRKIINVSDRGKTSTLGTIAGCPEQMVELGIHFYVLGQPDCSSNTTRVFLVNGHTGLVSVSDDLGEWGVTLVAQGTDIWVGHARGTALRVLDSQTLRSHDVSVAGLEVWALAADDQFVFAGGRVSGSSDDGLVALIDARSRKELFRAPVSELVLAMGVDQANLFVVGDKGTVWVFDATDLTLLRTIHLGMGAFRSHTVMVAEGALLISAQMISGENGGVFVIDDYAQALDLVGR